MDRISARVGVGGRNDAADVKLVQTALVRHAKWLDGQPPPAVNGQWDTASARALIGFQKDGAALLKPDGIVDPNSFTMNRLGEAVITGPSHRIFLALCWAHDGAVEEADFDAAARTLGVDVATIKAVARVETKQSPWDLFGRPTILFERHKFSSFTAGRYDRSHPDISSPHQGGYGPSSKQYARLRRAAMLDETAALKAASWGTYQILGQYFAAAGYADVAGFVEGMMLNEKRHLSAFVSFIQADHRLSKALRAKNWTTFARLYNGPAFRRNNYDTQLAAAYAALHPASAPVAHGGAARQPQPAVGAHP